MSDPLRIKTLLNLLNTILLKKSSVNRNPIRLLFNTHIKQHMKAPLLIFRDGQMVIYKILVVSLQFSLIDHIAGECQGFHPCRFNFSKRTWLNLIRVGKKKNTNRGISLQSEKCLSISGMFQESMWVCVIVTISIKTVLKIFFNFFPFSVTLSLFIKICL